MSQFATWEETVLSKGREIAESERGAPIDVPLTEAYVAGVERRGKPRG